jgi:hypothetical protein
MSDNNNKVKQENNTVGGDQAGRDINNYNFGNNSSRLSQMTRLIEKFKTEKANNPQLSVFINELEHFTNRIGNENVIGLEEKLKAGNRENIIEFALRNKELYSRKLLKFQFSEAAQQINVYLLGLAEVYFTNYVYPKICNDESESAVNTVLIEQVINPLINELDENVLDFSPTEINGMIYFLTGNCHIKWSK